MSEDDNQPSTSKPSTSKEEQEKEEDNECSICFEQFRDKVTLWRCRHQFCKKCLMTWARKLLTDRRRLECPHCRRVFNSFFNEDWVLTSVKKAYRGEYLNGSRSGNCPRRRRWSHATSEDAILISSDEDTGVSPPKRRSFWEQFQQFYYPNMTFPTEFHDDSGLAVQNVQNSLTRAHTNSSSTSGMAQGSDLNALQRGVLMGNNGGQNNGNDLLWSLQPDPHGTYGSMLQNGVTLQQIFEMRRQEQILWTAPFDQMVRMVFGDDTEPSHEPQRPSGGLSRGLSGGPSGGPSGGQSERLSGGLAGDLSGGLPVGLSRGQSERFSGGLAGDLSGELPEGLPRGQPERFSGGVAGDLSGGIPVELSREQSGGLGGDLSRGLSVLTRRPPVRLPGGLAGDLSGGIPVEPPRVSERPLGGLSESEELSREQFGGLSVAPSRGLSGGPSGGLSLGLTWVDFEGLSGEQPGRLAGGPSGGLSVAPSRGFSGGPSGGFSGGLTWVDFEGLSGEQSGRLAGGPSGGLSEGPSGGLSGGLTWVNVEGLSGEQSGRLAGGPSGGLSVALSRGLSGGPSGGLSGGLSGGSSGGLSGGFSVGPQRLQHGLSEGFTFQSQETSGSATNTSYMSPIAHYDYGNVHLTSNSSVSRLPPAWGSPPPLIFPISFGVSSSTPSNEGHDQSREDTNETTARLVSSSASPPLPQATDENVDNETNLRDDSSSSEKRYNLRPRTTR